MTDNPRLSLRLHFDSGLTFGRGKADLLQGIDEEGSIAAAGRRMGMSYRRAWQLVDTMNRCWCEPLVETSPGSHHGGGARVTPLGSRVLALYRGLQAALAQSADGADLAELRAALLAVPKANRKD